MHLPAYLQVGDTIAITCPSGYLPIEKVQDAVTFFQSKGFNVIVGATVGSNSENYFSASDEIRAQELQSFLDNKDIKAIVMGRGGYGMSRIIDDLSFEIFKKYPKWIVGFSDITLLHNHLQSMGVASLHAPMCAAFMPNDIVDMAPILDAVISGITSSSIVYPTIYDPDNIDGFAEGRIVGGNLAMISHGIGSASEIQTDNAILFIEDVGEHLYKIDRMLYQIKRADKLSNLKGVLIGYFSDAEDTTRPFGKDLKTILREHFDHLNIPVCYNFPAGHEDINYALTLGAIHRLSIVEGQVSLTRA